MGGVWGGDHLLSAGLRPSSSSSGGALSTVYSSDPHFYIFESVSQTKTIEMDDGTFLTPPPPHFPFKGEIHRNIHSFGL